MPVTARYLALGDSFTIGTGSTPEQAFPAGLARRWREAGCVVELRNLGVNGYTTDDVTQQELPVFDSFAPVFVTLAVGANDIVRGRSEEDYRTRVRAMLVTLTAPRAGRTTPRVITLPQPDWSLSPAAASFGDVRETAAKIERFNQILHEESDAVGARYVDLFPLMRQQAQAGMIAGDGLHPSSAAYDAWAGALAETLPRPCQAP